MGYLFSLIELFIWLAYYFVVALGYIIVLIFYLIKEIVNFILNKNGKKTSKFHSKNKFEHQNIEFVDYDIEESKVSNISQNKSSWFENKFEKEADLWGLSKEDRRIAKEERRKKKELVHLILLKLKNMMMMNY